MEALTLWDVPPYQPHSATSKDAADSMAGKTGSLRARVLDLLKVEALTDEEIATRLNLAGNTARPRRIELVSGGLVIQSGTRKTASGRTAAVWSAVTPTSIGA
jgi:predicted ArsR family transcriptional regulator